MLKRPHLLQPTLQALAVLFQVCQARSGELGVGVAVGLLIQPPADSQLSVGKLRAGCSLLSFRHLAGSQLSVKELRI